MSKKREFSEFNGGTGNNADIDVFFPEMVKWIQQNGGYVHPALQMFVDDDDDNDDDDDDSKDQDQDQDYSKGISYRGIRIHQIMSNKRKSNADSAGGTVAHEDATRLVMVSKDEVLVRIPMKCAVSGILEKKERRIQQQDNKESGKYNLIPASPWLRCVRSLMKAKVQSSKECKQDDGHGHSNFFTPYIRSLPKSYDTLLNWTDEELEGLRGTVLYDSIIHQSNILHTGADFSISLHDDMYKAIRERWESLKEYLSADCEGESKSTTDISQFVWAIDSISTRGFHMQQSFQSNDDDNDNGMIQNGDYYGPFMLPLIDLLNHCSTEDARKGATLKQDPADGSFILCSDRDLFHGEELLHSYGNINSQQQLKTYGFVDVRRVVETCSNTSCRRKCDFTPAIINRSEVIDIARKVALEAFVKYERFFENDGEIEFWDPSVCWDRKKDLCEKAPINQSFLIPDHIVIRFDLININEVLLTLICVLLLPLEAFEEFISDPSFLDESILEDPFLYHLASAVCRELLKDKMSTYTGASVTEDTKRLKQNDQNPRSLFARAIVLEEKICIQCCLQRFSRKENITIQPTLIY